MCIVVCKHTKTFLCSSTHFPDRKFAEYVWISSSLEVHLSFVSWSLVQASSPNFEMEKIWNGEKRKMWKIKNRTKQLTDIQTYWNIYIYTEICNKNVFFTFLNEENFYHCLFMTGFIVYLWQVPECTYSHVHVKFSSYYKSVFSSILYELVVLI